jgi:predicted DNA-binding transcriptional regulator AlpA
MMAEGIHGEPFVNAVQVGRMLGKSPDWVRRQARAKKLPRHYVGRDLRFLESEIRTWVQNGTPRSGSGRPN